MPANYMLKSFPSLTAVMHQMVLRAPSGLDTRTIAELSGYASYNTMMSELSRQPGHKLGVEMLLPLMDACASDAPLEFLARERGGVFLRLQQPAVSGGELVASLAVSIREFGEYASGCAVRIADGDVDPDEMAKIDKETNDVVEAVLAFRRLARDTHEAKYGKP